MPSHSGDNNTDLARIAEVGIQLQQPLHVVVLHVWVLQFVPHNIAELLRKR
jgi:hypothetical protein